MNDLEQMKSEIQILKAHLQKQNELAQVKQKKYEKLLEDFEVEKTKKLEKVLKEGEKKMDEALAQARVDQTFKKHSAIQEIRTSFPELVKSSSSPIASNVESAEDFAKKFPPGSKVFVASLQQDGVVQSTPNSKGEVLILSESMRLQVSWSTLKPPQKPNNPTSQVIRQSSSVSIGLSDQDRTLDLRGKTVEEAVEELEVTLDRAIQQKEDRLKIIHGHGTEALKRGVRTYLSRSLYVKKWKAGNSENGGDGVTWVELAD